MLQEAQKAAESAKHLQALRDTFDDDKFQITGVNLARESFPALVLHEDILEQISNRSEWAWSERGQGGGKFPYRASITMFDVEFFAIFSHATAVEYGMGGELEKTEHRLIATPTPAN